MEREKKQRKHVIKAAVFLAVMALCLLAGPGGNARAANKLVTNPGAACKSGKHIYYAYEMSGIRMGIMRLDPATGKTKKLTGYQYKGRGTNGFYSLSMDGNYIYTVWDQFYGTSGSEDYIYRISKNGKSKKKLGQGTQPVIAGNYIYYIEVGKDSYGYQQKTGYICRMKKNGSGKKRMAYNKEVTKLYSDGKKVYYSTYRSDHVLYDLKGKMYSKSIMNIVEDQSGYSSDAVTISGYRYYIVRNAAGKAATLYRQKIKGNKKNVVANFESGILSYRVCGSYVMVKCTTGSYTDNSAKLNVYCISANGKKKKKLASWRPAE